MRELQTYRWTQENMYLTVSANDAAEHVEYILAAEFDVDKGPTVKFQYPRPIDGDEELLAELMLPDQAHAREEDWTVFFLHKRKRPKSTGGRPRSTSGGGRWTGDEHNPMLYVLNLANTKACSDAKRGAIVRAMAICTRHSFIQIYKPILLLAMAEYFHNPSIDVLRNLYQSLNAMDISRMPSFGPYEKQILLSNSMQNLFTERFQFQQMQTFMQSANNVVHAHNSVSSHDSISAGSNKHDTHFFESKIKFNNLDIPMRIPVDSFPDCVGDPSPILLLTAILNTLPKSYSVLHPHLTTSGSKTHPLIVLMNGLLTEKRVIFMGPGRAAKDVVDAVLSACALVSSGILRGFSHRAYPYTDLSKIDKLIHVPGYIAGVTNPAFESHPSWWDILCNIETGEVRISKHIRQPERVSLGAALPASTRASVPGDDISADASFIQDIKRMVLNRYGERVIRARFREFIGRFIQLCAAYDEARGVKSDLIGSQGLWPAIDQAYVISGRGYVWLDDQQKMRDLNLYRHVVAGWKTTSNYDNYIFDLKQYGPKIPITNIDLQHQIDRLRKLHLSPRASAEIFDALRDVVVNPDQITQLLACLPQSQSGLQPLVAGLFHTTKGVRYAVVEILDRIRNHVTGRHFYDNLGQFHKIAFERLCRKMVTAGSGDEQSLLGDVATAMM
ncbi:docking domain of Afi1 for Arf3 in vesicle trafficking-domain-containing protein [Lipomyces tetrasporus]|uniref:Docking domain of Afi1 for Arf3 in vesicle trafficking-domain-containing protein n=1 Tax=Lipomyces tetrasporus TaxID=54092 RepID=A0AAD7QY14_9ASCO|nr:docking domain of Afi1 for Arf3 in vesicle trafficking-domain-containing protein [Lipomyces tetrasporus]KAJ8103529.1 docking domain of Afi1 for Arf3 in vesicle trafficking-domain-containing protein [Lipomyces tetrasporus]